LTTTSCDESSESKSGDDGKDIYLSYNQGNRIIGAFSAITCLLKMGFGSDKLIRPLVGKMNYAIEEQKVSEGKVEPVIVQKSHFICSNTNAKENLAKRRERGNDATQDSNHGYALSAISRE